MQTKWVEVECDNKKCTRNEDGTPKVVVVKADSFTQADAVVMCDENWIVIKQLKKKAKHFCCEACKNEAT